MYHINSTEYERNFWNAVTRKNPGCEGMRQGKHTGSGSYKLPSADDKAFTEAMKKESVFRSLATVVNAPGSDRTIFTCDAQDIATWLGDGSLDTYYDGVDDFKKLRIHAHRLGTIVRVHEDFLQDTGFNIRSYLIDSFSKRMGRTEEDAFINGDGKKMPTGILSTEGGAEIGVTAGAITYEDTVKLYFSVKKEYRKNGVWMMNDETAQALRTMKDEGGNYIWNHANDTIMGKKVVISNAMPSVATGAKPVAFGDFSYYWIVQRFPFTVKVMEELYAMHQQVGYLGYAHMDGKLIRPEAIKVMQMTDTAA